MSSKTVLYEAKDTRLRYDVAVALRSIAAGLASGTLQLSDGFGSACVGVGDVVKYEVEIKEKVKDDGVKRSVDIELEWYESTQAPEKAEADE